MADLDPAYDGPGNDQELGEDYAENERDVEAGEQQGVVQPDGAGDDSDDESLLSEVDEAQFADFDATAVQVAPDLETLSKHIKVTKRKRPEGEQAPVKRKEGRREKSKKIRRGLDSDDGFSGGEQMSGKRVRKPKGTEPNEARKRKTQDDVADEHLTPEERRRKALDKAMDAALKSNRLARTNKNDLDSYNDEAINDLRGRMIKAAEADAVAHDQGQPAFHKIKMLPEVTALLHRNTQVQALIDPDTNLLEAVRFFLEPLNDGALPAYNIQRDLFAAISKLPIGKESLIASGIGKVTLFYTKSKKVELSIKRQAEKLIQEWTRPLLQKSDDHAKKKYKKVRYEMKSGSPAPAPAPSLVQKTKAAAPGEKKSNRARLLPGHTGYTIVPESQIVLAKR